ncbi:hypothetical protein CMT52_07715 [Elizabethkingia anophelis]|nr:hypothetical protein [Elizabethkingia anophelis]
MLIDQHYQHYLGKVDLKESEMPEAQRIEIKRAFAAGMASMFVAVVTEIEMPEKLDEYKDELIGFWEQEIKK